MTTDTIDNLRKEVTTLPCRFAENGDKNDIWSNDSSVSEETNLYNGFTSQQALTVAYPWKIDYQYNVDEMVEYGSKKYVCVQQHVSSEDNVPPNDDYWAETSDLSGRPVLRGDVNGLGYLCTDETFYQMCGGVYEYDPNVAQAINGYPENAILSYFDADGKHRFVKCIKQGGNCFVDYRTTGPDNVNWKIVSGEVTEAYNTCIIPSNLYTETLNGDDAHPNLYSEEVTATASGLCYIVTETVNRYSPGRTVYISRGGTKTQVSAENTAINSFMVIPVVAGDSIQIAVTQRTRNQTFGSTIYILYP